MNMKEIASVNDIKDGQIKMFKYKDRKYILVRTGGKFYCSDNRCPHMGGDLSKGSLAGTVITCPRHHSQFDLIDGHIIRWTDWSGLKLTLSKLFKPPQPLRTYDVHVDGEKVMASLD